MSLKDFILNCHNYLMENKTDREVQEAQSYLKKRYLSDESLSLFKIGYCSRDCIIPDSVRFFGDEINDNGSKWDLSERLRERIIVPIYDEFNNVVGVTTKKSNFEKENFWWNMPSPFKKGAYLFLLNLAKKEIFDKNKVYLVEGYMDAMILRQYGLRNVVAVMGTTLTSRKLGLIARYCNNVCICFDMDANESGQKARDLSIAVLKKYDFCDEISIINGLPIGEDPDVFVAKNGLDKFLEKEFVLKDVDIEKVCRGISKNKNYKEIVYAK